MCRRILVAGVSNIFFGDDGFGVEVARRLASRLLPEGVEVRDFGIRGVHLAYELRDGCDTLILMDAIGRGEAPGTVFVLQPELDRDGEAFFANAHNMHRAAVLKMVGALGGRIGRPFVVGCEPLEIVGRIGLSRPVARAVEDALALVRRLIAQNINRPTAPGEEA